MGKYNTKSHSSNLWYFQQVKERCEETDKLIDDLIEASKPSLK
jgi:hypothetical protein